MMIRTISKSPRVSRTANRPLGFGRAQWDLACGHPRQARISNPYFCKILSSLSAIPMGFFSPAPSFSRLKHWCSSNKQTSADHAARLDSSDKLGWRDLPPDSDRSRECARENRFPAWYLYPHRRHQHVTVVSTFLFSEYKTTRPTVAQFRELKKPEQQTHLQDLPAANQSPMTAYLMKAELKTLWTPSTTRGWRSAWKQWPEHAHDSKIPALIQFAKQPKGCWRDIVSRVRWSMPTG